MGDFRRGQERTPTAMMRAEEAAALLGVSKRTVHCWLRAGRIPGTKVGKLWLIPRGKLIPALWKGTGASAGVPREE